MGQILAELDWTLIANITVAILLAKGLGALGTHFLGHGQPHSLGGDRWIRSSHPPRSPAAEERGE